MSEHAPTPWEYAGRFVKSFGRVIASCPRPQEGSTFDCNASAAFITLACNSHDDLVKALEGVIRIADRATDEFDAARAALAKARGETP